jgi:hypothetical protein
MRALQVVTLAMSSTAWALCARDVSAPGFARSVTVPAGPAGTLSVVSPQAG